MRLIVAQIAHNWKQRIVNIKCPYNSMLKINQMNSKWEVGSEIIMCLGECGYFDIFVSFL